MRSRSAFLLLVCIFFIASSDSLYAQHTTVTKDIPTRVRKDIAFIVRKPDKVKTIAGRFHIASKTLVKINHPIRRGQTMYAGKKLVIPVWLKRKSTYPSSDFDLADYTLDTDSLDMYIREDFVCIADIERDSVRKMAIDKEIKKIDRKILSLNWALDSIEEDGRHNLSNRDIKKLPMARARRIGNFALGLQVDSLVQQRKKIIEERTKIEIRVADYEYLVENASYMASHPVGVEAREITFNESTDEQAKANTRSAKEKK